MEVCDASISTHTTLHVHLLDTATDRITIVPFFQIYAQNKCAGTAGTSSEFLSSDCRPSLQSLGVVRILAQRSEQQQQQQHTTDLHVVAAAAY